MATRSPPFERSPAPEASFVSPVAWAIIASAITRISPARAVAQTFGSRSSQGVTPIS